MNLSFSKQDDDLRRDFPDFRLVAEGFWYDSWEGQITPICQTYRIRIKLLRRKKWQGFSLKAADEIVTVLDPPIGFDPRRTGEPPQHVYPGGNPAFPRLCVYDPDQGEWTREMSVARVLIPMVIKWLAFHEDWVDTGVWRGGGRHPEPRQEKKWQPQTLAPDVRAHREQFQNAEFHRLGLLIGASASYPLMVGEFVEYFRLPFWPKLRSDFAKAEASPITLTSSPAPQQGA